MEASKLPDHWTFAITILFFMLVEDFVFGMSHRLLHTPWLYKNVHKQHHQHIVTVSIAAHYAHPAEYFLSNLMPTVLGPLLLGNHTHMFTVLCWYALR